MWLRIVLAAAVAWGSYHAFAARAVKHAPGAIAPHDPVQRELARAVAPIETGSFTLTPLARFEVEARVLGQEVYKFDQEAKLAPVDLALGWGPMSDSGVLSGIQISQSGRFYFWRTQSFPVPRAVIESHSGNMHMIPATREIERKLKGIRVGQVVSFSGYLVNASRPDGWRWTSSLSRTDTGAGACELVYVTELAVN